MLSEFGKNTTTHNNSHTSAHYPRQKRHSEPMHQSHTVFGITSARFKIGHTPRKLPGKPPATFRFFAYLLQSRSYIISHDFRDCKLFSGCFNNIL